jgi:hypothetical protein
MEGTMFNNFSESQTEKSLIQEDDFLNAALELQKKYWTFNIHEKEVYISRYPNNLSWSELLRLNHLICMEIINQDEVRHQLNSGNLKSEIHAAQEDLDLYREITRKLVSDKSPYRPRYCSVWQGKQDYPSFTGKFYNISATHLASMEVIRLDENKTPVSIDFIPLDELHGVILGSYATFRLARVGYEFGKSDEIVLIPLIYGISWNFDNYGLKDGSSTVFINHLDIPQYRLLSIGLGHQNFTCESDRYLLALGTINEIEVALEMVDSRFEEKCRGRGLDPARIIHPNVREVD